MAGQCVEAGTLEGIRFRQLNSGFDQLYAKFIQR